MDSTPIRKKFGHLQIPLEDLLQATDNFAPENIISQGSFGPAYKGRLLRSGNLIKIAAKRLDPRFPHGHVHFWNEVSMLSDLDHKNIVSMIGFCDEKGEKIIITPSMANGSLQEDLDNPDLTWKQRLKISIGVARALGYLRHDEGRSYGVIHRNINSSTILLDENWEPKLSGFGMSIKQSVNRADHVILSKPIRTLGYMDPEIEKMKGVTHKSDIYAFGVVLFEILCGRKAFIEKEEEANRFLAPLAKCHYENNTLEDIIHPNLRSQMYPQSLVKYSEVAYSCLNEDRTRRPDVNDIISLLERTLKRQLGLEKLETKGLQHLKISLGDILLASDNFSERYRSGYFNDIIEYIVERDHFDKEKPSSKEGKNKGELPKIHNNVLIKRFIPTYEKQEEFFFTEIEILTSINHRNIVTPIGFCVEGSEMVLVFENPSNGYLRDYLSGRREICILTWEKRLKICIDVAHALNYLHYEMEDKTVIIHTNIHSAKFELDEMWGAKIDDYETAVFRPSNQEDEAFYQNKVVGTKYYRDPEHEKTGMLTRESDVYSFGVVLFEILCGKLAGYPIYLESHKGGLAPLARRNFGTDKLENMIDPTIKEVTNKDSLHSFIEIAYQCVAETQDQRPTIKVVVKELEKALSFQEKQVQQQDKNSVVDELQKANHEISEEQIQQDKDQVVNELQKEEQVQKDKNQVVDELQKANHEILRNNFDLKIPLDVIKSATHNFDGTYRFRRDIDGCMWYRVELNYFHKENHSSVEGKNKGKHLKRHNNTVVIKRYPSRHRIFKEEIFWTEIEMLTGVQHQNIAILLGFCAEASELILVIDNFSNGFLGSFLGEVNKMRIFSWEKRLKICIDIAHALNYLHYEMEDQKKIINRDICSENIGLDENWGAKIVNFWLSIFLPPNQEDEALYLNLRLGRTFCRDPEYELTNKLKRESDVYSFGVVLFEILCGRLASDPIYNKEGDGGLAVVARQSLRSRTLEKMIDPIIKEETNENNFVLKRGPNKDSLNTFIEIAIQCVAETQDQRPSMKVVVRELEKALLSQQNNKENPSISLEDINQATQNFHNDNCVGGGGFGKVYTGKLQDGDGYKTIVAKRLNTRYGQGEQQFLTELQILIEYKHENIIGLVGYCNEKDEKIIVYEYASKRSLDWYLNDVSLTWVKRLNICIDVASALAFLHGGLKKQAKVIHRDIKSANILLNHGWKAKLGDFGLSLISPLIQEADYVIDRACGTPGYLDPLYNKSGFLTIESDIYSFGVVLFEILCGRSMFAIQKQEGYSLPDFIKKKFEEGKDDEVVVFEQIREEIVPKSLTTFQEIAYQCLHHEREKRPTTKKVLIQLKKALEFQNMSSTIVKFAHLQIPLEDVVKATNSFHHDNIIGQGDFGRAYKGRLLWSGRLMNIAARRFDCKYGDGDLKFLKEISVLSDLSHPNLISIIGFCDEKDEKIVVTTYEASGSLGQYLNSQDLTWTQILKICVSAARALSYLHCDEGRDYAIIHCNINSNTILLDEKNWEAKLSGFEHSVKQLECYKNEECICEYNGAMECKDPAIEKTGGVTQKSDIYSIGVVLFEMLCGRKAFVPSNATDRFSASLAKYHYENGRLRDIINPDLWNQMSTQSLFNFSKIAYSCLNEERTHRPNAHDIVHMLEKELEAQLLCKIERNNFDLKIPLDVIKSATHNFSDTYRFQLDGDGCIWYRVELNRFQKENHLSVEGKNKGEHPKRQKNIVAIKRYPSRHNFLKEEKLFTEIEMLTGVKHPNIANLLGFCAEASELILVIDNFSNGFLSSYLKEVNKMRIFTWEKRLKICIDVAHALNYLHYEMEDQKMITNRDICCYNIGLDEKCGAKIVNFWCSVFLPQTEEEEALYYNHSFVRTFYIDPEYKLTRKLKRESDVYSFGVLLFEILCGRPANDPIYKKESDKGLAVVARQRCCSRTLEKMIDPIIKEETSENKFVLKRGPNKDSLDTFIEIAIQCVAEAQYERPSMKVVVRELEKALLFQENNKDGPKISLEDIKFATQNFHDENCIGGEVFGRVYKGNLQDGDGFKTIAARRLGARFGQVEKQFLNELQILWEYKHENVISLVGYCDDQDEKVIVYEYASRRSLDRYLNDDSLTWLKRLNICIDVASALDFFHGGVGKQANVIHGDIKTASILLDRDWKAKLADFRLSLIIPIVREIEYVIDYACGTPGYVDPAYKKSRYLTKESDIYSFGVVLFEILCGRSTTAILEHHGHYLPDFIENRFEEGKHDEVVFEQIRQQIVPKSLTTFHEIAYQCLHHERERRPTAKRVLTELKKALEFQNMTSTINDKFAHLRIPLEDVVKATNNFHHDNIIIGHGGPGTAYRGRLYLRSERLMEITARRFDWKHGEGHLEFLRESTVLLDLEHTNLVSVIGFCDEKDEKIIVTRYEANGNLGQCLTTPNLTWTQRLRVCVGVARALSYLHDVEGRDYSIIHCNINSDVILLDENWEAKLYGFEHSIKQVEHSKDHQVSLCEHTSTMGYIDPAIEKTGGVTQKSDIYALGVILFEVLCGRRAFVDDHENEANRFLVSLAKYHYENKSLQDILKVDLCDQMSPQSLLKYSNLAYSCLNEDRARRPNIDDIVDQLTEAMELQLRYENILDMVPGVYSNDNNLQLEATTQFRKLLSTESPPIEEVIQSGVVPRFVEFLMREDFPQVQVEAAWALTNIASGTSENTKVVIDHGSVPIFVKLLASPSDDVREQAVWALGNVAGDSPRCRDLVLGHGALIPLLSQLNEHAKLSMLRNATRTLSNFCRGKPQPPFEQTRPALSALERLIHSNDEEVLTDACWALSYLSDGTNDQIQAVIDAGVCQRLVELLLHPSPSVLIPALRTVGNIVTGDDLQTQHIIERGALPCLLSLLTHDHKESIKKEACWTISNITAGNKEQIQTVIAAGLIAPLVNLLQTAEFDIKKEAAWTISNATSGGTNEQIKYLVIQGCIKPLCDLLVCPDPTIVTASLEGLENILKVGEVEKQAGNAGDVNLYAQLIDDADGLGKIENLQRHDNNEIYEKAVKIRMTYWVG